jgi:hypothetical protein
MMHVWEYARDRGLLIVSKDNDFRQPQPSPGASAEGNLARGGQRGYE